MDGLEIDRDGENVYSISDETKEKMELAKQESGRNLMNMGAQGGIQSGQSEYYLDTDEKKEDDA
jgi:hypothetical protein